MAETTIKTFDPIPEFFRIGLWFPRRLVAQSRHHQSSKDLSELEDDRTHSRRGPPARTNHTKKEEVAHEDFGYSIPGG
ncbi:MAG: hypothetical protein SF339_07205 [Blastocatellia bacterium]|nr:hypothetical protein [Blastocatellia bacterium]